MNTESGIFSRCKYDECAYAKFLNQSVEPLGWKMYAGKYENEKRCVYDSNSNYKPFDTAIIDMESDLRGINRQLSRCDENKFCEKRMRDGKDASATDPKNPIVLDASLCPIVKNNIIRPTEPGYTLTTDGNYKTRTPQ
jgi:hypothetical protein